jgi:hypothetical protein
MKKLMLILSSLFIFIGCPSTVTNFKLGFIPQNPPSINRIYRNGFEVAVSQQSKTIIALAGEKTEDDYLRLWIWCKNTSDTAIDLLPKNIWVKGIGGNDEKIHYVYTPEKFIRKLQDEQKWELTFKEIAAGFDAYNAGNKTSTTYTTATASAHGSDGSYAYGTAQGTSTTHTYDNAAASEVLARNQSDIQRQSENYISENNLIESGLLKSTTLFSGQSISGSVMLDYESGYSDKYLVVVPIGGDIHKIWFKPIQEE